MHALGKHLTVDMYGCSFAQLDDVEFIRNAMFTAISGANMHLLSYSYHKFEPQGLTSLALLAESHMSIHTYPEMGYAAIDVFTCGDHSLPDKAVAILKTFLKPEKTRTTHIMRGDFGAANDMKPRSNTTAAPLRRVRDTSARVFRFLVRRRRK